MTIRQQAEVIRDETVVCANTANRVGTCLVDIADQLLAVDPRTMVPVFAEIAMNENATPTHIAVAGTYYKILGATSTVLASAATITNGRITVATGQSPTVRRYATITGRASVFCDTGSHVLHIVIAKNGTPITTVIGTNTTNNSPSKEAGIAVSLSTDIGDGDYFELFITEKDHAESLTVTHMSLQVTLATNYTYEVE